MIKCSKETKMAHLHELFDYTSSAFILHPTETKICLHLHKKLGVWLQPGGHIELNEDPQEALVHELLEEVGFKEGDYEILQTNDQPQPRHSKTLPLPFHLNVHHFADTNHRHIDFGYLIKSKTDKFKPQTGESKQIEWLSQDEILILHKKGKIYDGTLDICEWIFDKYMNIS